MTEGGRRKGRRTKMKDGEKGMGRRKARSRLIPNPVPSRQFVLDLVLYDRLLFRSLRERQVKRGFLLFLFLLPFPSFFLLVPVFSPVLRKSEGGIMESRGRDVSPCKATRHRETLPSAATIINHSSFTAAVKRRHTTSVKRWLLQTNRRII